jgi:hypothetical protein
LGFRELVGVHVNTVTPNHDLKSKVSVKSCWLVAMAAAQNADSFNLLQKFVAGEPAARRHQPGTGRQ